MISSGDFLPIGGPGVFLRPSHSSEHGREVETPLTIIGLLSHMTISHYLLLECTCEFCFKRPIYRRKCAPQEPQASAGEPALVQHETSSWLCRDSLHLAIPAKPKSLNAPYFCPAVEQQLTLELNWGTWGCPSLSGWKRFLHIPSWPCPFSHWKGLAVEPAICCWFWGTYPECWAGVGVLHL